MKTVIPELTIIVPAKNEEKYIGKLLDSISTQDYPGISSVPIYIADAGSTDCTREVVMRYKEELNVSIIDGGIPSVGRNCGAKVSKSEYVLFIDADITFTDSTTIRRALDVARLRSLDLVTIAQRCPEGTLLERIFYELANIGKVLSQFTRPFANGMFMLFRKETFDKLGGFDERIHYSEDTVLSYQIDRHKFAVIPGSITTPNRLFKRGHWRIFWLGVVAVLKRGDPKFFYRDFHYFE